MAFRKSQREALPLTGAIAPHPSPASISHISFEACWDPRRSREHGGTLSPQRGPLAGGGTGRGVCAYKVCIALPPQRADRPCPPDSGQQPGKWLSFAIWSGHGFVVTSMFLILPQYYLWDLAHQLSHRPDGTIC